MPKSLKLSILALSVVLVLVVLFGGLLPGGVRAAANDEQGAYRQMKVYSEVLQRIQGDYVEDPNIDKVTVGALHGLMEGLDAESSYLTAEEYKAYKAHQNEGKVQVGLSVSKRYGYATVISVEPGSPAEKAGINDGDVIESIGDQSTRDMSLAMIRLVLDGQPGTTVTFSLVRPRRAEPEKMTLTRTSVAAPLLGEQQYENSSILYLKPGVLSKERVQQCIERLKTMQKNGNQKVLLDLRDDSEGDNEQAIRLANAFLNTGTITTLQGQKYAKQVYTAEAKGFVTAAPLAVLVNRGTAGPSELVASAILDNKRGDVVGDRTFGEGAVQKVIELPTGDALILSVAKYFTPAGKVLEDDAVTPNVQVAQSDDTAVATDDDDNPATPPVVQKPVQHVDDQLNRALDLLRKKAA